MLPKHIGIIMDGNGRWAKKRGLPRKMGHINGAKAIKAVVRHCQNIGVSCLTIYAFSTENWKRPKEEVDALMKLLRQYLDQADLYVKDNIKVRFIGDLSIFDDDIKEQIKDTEKKCVSNTGMDFCIAINYGGRAEIVHATKEIAKKVASGEIEVENIDEKAIDAELYTAGLPEVDLLIRPSGEYRTSNFLIWQSAYAEFVFMNDILWPDFRPEHLDLAISEFERRNRRFGGI